MAGPRKLVSPPPFTPLPYGLLSVVESGSSSDNHWQNGITYESWCVTGMGGTTFDECISVTGTGGPPPAPPTKTPNVQKGIRGATPFTVYVEFDCATVGNEDALERARRALDQAEPIAVERAFWTGQAGGQPVVYPHLAANSVVFAADGVQLQSVPVTGGSTTLPVPDGVGFLEDAMADCYGGVGVIHVPMRVLPILGTTAVVSRGSRLTTLNGNWIASGAGYPGTAPDGSAPAAGSTWLYATSQVFMYRGEVKIPSMNESIDRTKNTVKMIAERTYVLAWECCYAAVLVKLGT